MRFSLNGRQSNMTTISQFALAVVLAMSLPFDVSAEESATSLNDDELRFFAEQVEPLLKSKCFGCHSHASGEMGGGLTLDSRSGWVEGGEHGPAIVPGKPEESLLIKAVLREDSKLQMPPDEKLSAAETSLLTEWVKRGAPDPRITRPVLKHDDDATDWWSLQPLERVPVPEV
ncbi:MAG: hypothetical protein O2983_14635, partial [Planctomycetota bacterium]|nr:hypothetical protein [Planctomycetota bacterium]